MAALTDPALYDTEPENAWRRLKPRRHTAKYLAVLKGVAAWRERTAQDRDQPRGRILKDDAIDELATQAPTSLEELGRLRALSKGFAGSRFAPDLIEAIRVALKDPDAYAPETKRPAARASAPTGAVVELLKVLLKARAEDAGVASKLIATVADLEKIASDDDAQTPALEGWHVAAKLSWGRRPEAQARRTRSSARRRQGAGGGSPPPAKGRVGDGELEFPHARDWVLQEHDIAVEPGVGGEIWGRGPIAAFDEADLEGNFQAAKTGEIGLIAGNSPAPLVGLQHHLVHDAGERVQSGGIPLAAPVQQSGNA